MTAVADADRVKALVPKYDAQRNWEPFEAVVSKDHAPFVHLGRSGSIEIYFNETTRKYLNIDNRTHQCFAEDAGFYSPICTEDAIRQALIEEMDN